MLQALQDVLCGREENYLLPFFWQHGDHTDRLTAQIEEIRRSGCRAFCVESRPHKDFAGPGWWRDMDVILAEAKKRDMKVWILDDDHFPTGHAVGLIGKKYPDLRPRYLLESHADVIGPMSGAALIVGKVTEQDALLTAVAVKQTPDGRHFGGERIDVTAFVKNDTLYWDVPEGVWRVFFVMISRHRSPDYIDMLRAESCHAMIEAVYEPHWAHYEEYFGNTIAGFFSDEPEFHNDFFDSGKPQRGFYERTVGMPGVLMPYTEEVVDDLKKALGAEAVTLLPALWYDVEGAPELRYAYMDSVTRLYSRNFTQQLGNWCRAHGVQYIGHIIEDMNASARLGCTAGHYFRSLTGQDMAGMDIVLHQVVPGFAHNRTSGTFSGGEGNPDFFHYTLPKLCSSHSHIDPAMDGRAMCEVFGAFGWAEGTRTMKWLMDFLLVRGVNRFVPHAFSCTFPDPDCPPHFGCGGRDPQFAGFTALMQYTNRAAHLLSGGRHVANAAVLYHAEGEWMSRSEPFTTHSYRDERASSYANCDLITRALTDAHIDFDILPADTVMTAAVADGKLRVLEDYDCLLIPHSSRLPDGLLEKIAQLQKAGLTVLFAPEPPAGAWRPTVAKPEDMPAVLRGKGIGELSFAGTGDTMVRHYHTVKDGADVFMFSNESLTETAKTVVTLPAGVGGAYTRLDLLGGGASCGSSDGTLALTLAPYESLIFVFGVSCGEAEKRWKTASAVDAGWTIETASYEDLTAFTPYQTGKLVNIIAPDEKPDFGGQVRYTAVLDLPEDMAGGPLCLNLGQTAECAEVSVNGKACGVRICPPYRFDVTEAVKSGANTVVVTVGTNLAMPLRRPLEPFSTKLLIPPQGMMGPVTLETAE